MGNACIQVSTPGRGVVMEITPVTPAVRTAKVRAAKTAVPKSSSKAAPAVAAKPPTAERKRKVPAKQVVSSAAPDLAYLIATAAYYLAEQRQFTPGHELEDWLRAEQQVLAARRT
jgi:hypothetical protein